MPPFADGPKGKAYIHLFQWACLASFSLKCQSFLMANLNVRAQQDYLQKYMDAKNNGEDGLDSMIKHIITEFLVPQKRLVEAESWLKPIGDEKLLSQLKILIANQEANSDLPKINRLPKNRDWIDSDVSHEIKPTQDQQYHYDRIIAYLNYQKIMLDDRDDVFECRNEWITYMSYSTWGDSAESKIGAAGCLFTTLATAYHDYVENILLPNKFIEGAVEMEDSVAAATNSIPAQTQVQSNWKSIEELYAQDTDAIKYFQKNHPTLLKEGFLMNLYGFTKILGAMEEVIVSENYVSFLPAKKKGWSAGPGIIINRGSVTQISVGSEDHIEYQGITSSESYYWTITFETNQFQQYTRYLYLGRNEAEMNRNRPELGATLQRLGQFFDLVEGDSYTSSGGYTTSFGFGWWIN